MVHRPIPARNSLLAPGVLALALASVSASAQQPTALSRLAVHAAHMIDVVTGTRLDNAVVLIEGDRIMQVGSGLTVPAGTRTIDLGGATLLPGLIDVHAHLSSQSGDYYTGLFRRSPIDNAVRAPTYARRTLEAGFTSVRDVGAPQLHRCRAAGRDQQWQRRRPPHARRHPRHQCHRRPW